MTGLTERQLDVLDIVSYCYPVTARGVAAHLQISESAARSVLTALERKDLVHRMPPAPSSPRGRYTITKPGNAALRDQDRARVWETGAEMSPTGPIERMPDEEPTEPPRRS